MVGQSREAGMDARRAGVKAVRMTAPKNVSQKTATTGNVAMVIVPHLQKKASEVQTVQNAIFRIVQKTAAMNAAKENLLGLEKIV